MVKDTKEEKLFSGVILLNTKVTGLALGLLFGLIIFIMTNLIAIGEGGPINERGESIIEPFLLLMSQFFIGYNVSFLGSIIGFLYGFGIGTISGAILGWIYNKIVEIRN